MRAAFTAAVSAALLLVATAAFAPTADAAPSWRPPATVGPTDRESGAAEIAVAPDGEAIATWVGGRPNGIRVSRRRPGKGCPHPSRSRRPGKSKGPGSPCPRGRR